jgi:hypothetical protein
MPGPPHIQAQTLERFIEAWRKWSPKDWLKTFADDFTQCTLPMASEIPPRDKSTVDKVLPKLMEVVTNYQACILPTNSINVFSELNLSFLLFFLLNTTPLEIKRQSTVCLKGTLLLGLGM